MTPPAKTGLTLGNRRLLLFDHCFFQFHRRPANNLPSPLLNNEGFVLARYCPESADDHIMISEMISNNVDIATTIEKPPPKQQAFDIKFWGMYLASVVPWAINTKERIKLPTFFNRKLKKHAQQSRFSNNLSQPGISYATVRFRPYVSKVPWHTGPRAFLSQLFPRYGHYCGPNWSSGKDGGSLLWDKRPIDWLDYCCYCHDMGYDTHDQAELLKADLAFLECLERPHMATKGDIHVAHLYKTMCTSGLRSILIPYRQHLVKLKSGQLYLGFGWLSNMKWKGWSAQK